MAKEYTKEELWKLYEKLPQELKEVIFSEETANNIHNVCERNDIGDKRISEVARYTGRVLLGLLPLDDFQKTLEKEVKLEKEAAKRVARELFRFIFYSVKTSLEELYKTEIEPPAKPLISPTVTGPLKEASSKELNQREKPAGAERDVYREPIE